MKYLHKDKIAKLLPYAELIEELRLGFREGGTVPLRHHHPVPTQTGTENSLLLMPCWQQDDMLGLKMVMVCPDNNLKDMPSVSSTYLLCDATTGQTKAMLDGDELTLRRTAAASALASSFLSNKHAKSMLMMGTGKLAPHLIRAHCAVREIGEIYIWGRNFDKATHLAGKLDKQLSATVIAVENPIKYANICDIISCATLSKDPILKGSWLNPDKKQHIDLVGGYQYYMREADNDLVQACDIYVDTFDGALGEAGDILRPIDERVISRDDLLGDFYDMVGDDFRVANIQCSTMFKSVGTALEDLIAAKLAYNKSIQ